MDWVLYDAHSHDIERAITHICRRCRHTIDIDDFAQDARVFVASRSAIIFSRFQGHSSLTTYLTRILWHYYLHWRKAEGRISRIALEPARDGYRGLTHTPSLDSSDLGRKFEQQVALWVRSLSTEDRELIRGRFLLGRQMSQIATSEHLTRTAAFKRTYRLIDRLRRDLQADGVGKEDRAAIETWLRTRGGDLFAEIEDGN